jgi:hypothetical protein
MGIEYEVAETENGLRAQSRYDVQADVDVLLKQDSFGHKLTSVGFQKNEDGSYEAVGDFFEMSGARTVDGEELNRNSFKDAVSKRYTYFEALKRMQALHFSEANRPDFTQNEIRFTFQSDM